MANVERAFGVTNIKHHIPLVLDLDVFNYDAWRELFLTHCLTFDVLGHVDGTATPTDDDDIQWKKRDGLVKLWIYGTLAPPLFKSSFKTGGSAREVWLRIENQFRNNKESRAIQLDNDLRTQDIGDKTVRDYSQGLKSIADLLENVEAPVTDRTLVMYMLNGLNEKFDNIINVIKHQKPFPTFEEARNMLELEETRLKKPHRASATHTDTPSSSTALIAAVSETKPTENQRQHPRQNNRGNRRGGRGRGRYNNNQQRAYYGNWNPMPYNNWNGPYNQWQQQFPPQWNNYSTGSQQRQFTPRPQQHEGNMVDNMYQPTRDFAEAFNTMSLTEPSANWYMDSGASSHLASTAGNLQSVFKLNTGNSVVVGNGSTIPIQYSGNTLISSDTRPLALKNVLVAPKIVKNLISVRKFTKDNWCTVEFDPFGFTVKDLQSRKTLLRSDSSGDLYPIPPDLPTHHHSAFIAEPPSLWHKRLAHANNETLKSLVSSSLLSCNKDTTPLCHACQLGKHIKLPFSVSNNKSIMPFDLIHSDLWTSPVPSMSGIKYYVLFLDDFSHYLWVYPLRRKSEVFSKFLHFHSYVKNQFKTTIKALQCDNGGEYNNKQFLQFFSEQGIVFRFSCPHTSQQNGKAERMIRTINNAIRCLLFQAKMSPTFWAEALHAAAHILNILPSSAIDHKSPHLLLFGNTPTYTHLRVFGCLCFPNVNYSNLSKLSPRSTPCLFLGYPTNHRVYRCLDLKTKRIFLSRHVVFDESTFPCAQIHTPSTKPYHFLEGTDTISPLFRSILINSTPPPMDNPVAPAATSETQVPNTVSPPPNVLPVTAAPTRMTTRGQAGIVKPKKIFSLLTSSISRLPSSPQKALLDPNWNPSMTEEYSAQIKNKTWRLVPKPYNANVINSIWLYKYKYDADGNLRSHKSRLVANGKTQEEGIDYDETFSPVVKPATIRSVLDIALRNGWEMKQLDVKNAFLHGTISEDIYMHQPPGFVDKDHPHYVCKLEKALYGLKQAPRAWNSRFSTYLQQLGFVTTKSDASLFVYKQQGQLAYLLLYVDDIILTGSSKQLLHNITMKLKSEFPMTDMGTLGYFLGIKVDHNKAGIFLSQKQYALDIIQRAGMKDCKPLSTPADVNSKLAAEAEDKIADPKQYRSLAGALQYLTFTRPDIAYEVQQVCLFMHDPRQSHLHALKRIIRYVQGTAAFGLQMYKSSSNAITAYSDADWAGCPDTRRSTSGYCVYIGDNLISWSSKRQQTVSRSSAEAEYRGVANTVAESCWIRNLLLELHQPVSKATLVFCDNISSVYLSSNPVKHQRTKHVELDLHFVREKVAIGQVRVLHVPSAHQYADIFTKGLPSSLFIAFRSSLTVKDINAYTEGG